MSWWHGWRHKFNVRADVDKLRTAFHELGARVYGPEDRVDARLEFYPGQSYPLVQFMACRHRTDPNLWMVSIRIDDTSGLTGSQVMIERLRQKFPDPEGHCNTPIQKFEDMLREKLE